MQTPIGFRLTEKCGAGLQFARPYCVIEDLDISQ